MVGCLVVEAQGEIGCCTSRLDELCLQLFFAFWVASGLSVQGTMKVVLLYFNSLGPSQAFLFGMFMWGLWSRWWDAEAAVPPRVRK
jgi:hypothetical protein